MNQMTSEKYLNFFLLMAFGKFQHFNLESKISQKLFKPLPCHKSTGKVLHAICISAVAGSHRWASCGPWASCFKYWVCRINKKHMILISFLGNDRMTPSASAWTVNQMRLSSNSSLRENISISPTSMDCSNAWLNVKLYGLFKHSMHPARGN